MCHIFVDILHLASSKMLASHSSVFKLNKLLPKPKTIPVLAPDPAPALDNGPPHCHPCPEGWEGSSCCTRLVWHMIKLYLPPARPPYFGQFWMLLPE